MVTLRKLKSDLNFLNKFLNKSLNKSKNRFGYNPVPKKKR